MDPDDKTNRNQSQDDPPFDIDCSTETLTNEQKKQQKNNTWTSEVSDNTMLSAASGSLSGEHDDTGMLFDESELLGTSSQKESQDDSDEMTNSDQESTLEAEDKTPSPLAKRNTSPDGAKETSPERAKETPTSPKGAKNRTSQTKAKKPQKDQAKRRKTESTSAPTGRVTRNKPRLDYGSIHKGKNETPNTDRPTTSRDQQNTPDQQTQMNETRKLKTELKETKIKLERAEKDNNEKQNTIDNQLAKIIAQQDTIADLQTKIDNLEKQTTPNETEKLQDKISKLTKSKDEEKKKRKEIEKAKKENEKTLQKLQEQKEQDDRTISELTKKLEETREMAKDLQTLLEETEQINDHLLREHMHTQEPNPSTSQDNQPQRNQTRTKKMLIADSNRKYISPHLDTENSDWAVMGGIYTVDELHDVLDSGEHDDMIREQEIVVVMLGTNDIRGSKGRREKSGSKVFTDLLEACDRITSHFNTPTAIVQVPPQSSPAHDIEVAVLNTRLETAQTETPLVIHTQDIRRTPKDKTLQKDGFHLTDTAGQRIAEAINTATEDLVKPAELKVHKIETDRDNAKFVIGRKGTRIEGLRMKHNVTITTENKKEGNNSYCTIAIKGYKENTDAAAEEIKKILDDANRDLRLRLEEKNQEREICQFFIRGKCMFGNRCRNAHPAGEKRARSTERARPDDRRRPSSSRTHHSSPSPSPRKITKLDRKH